MSLGHTEGHQHERNVTMHGETILKEIRNDIADGKTGCIIFDFACYFPYANKLVFDFKLGVEELSDKKLNHRYPNKTYYTISRTYGRRISKIGYPYFFDIEGNTECDMLLNLTIGAKDLTPVNLIIPLKLGLTKEEPVCGLSMRYNFDEGTCEFHSNKSTGNGWQSVYWTTTPKEDDNDDIIVLNPVNMDKKTNTILFGDAIVPCPDKPENLLVGY